MTLFLPNHKQAKPKLQEGFCSLPTLAHFDSLGFATDKLDPPPQNMRADRAVAYLAGGGGGIS